MKNKTFHNVFSSVETEETSAMQIRNENSEFGSFFTLSIPFQLSMEYCSGAEQNDYQTYFSVSQKGYYYDVQPVEKSLPYYQNRPLHQHDFYELMLVLRGTVIQKIESKEFFYPSGSCCLINRNLRHSEKFTGRSLLLFIGLSVEFIQDLLNTTTLFSEEKQLKSCEIIQFILNDIQNPSQKAYLDFFPSLSNSEAGENLYDITNRMVETILFPSYGASHIIRGLLCNLFQFLTTPAKFHLSTVMPDSSADFLLFCRISHLLENAHGRINRTDLEQLLNYTGDYLNRIIKKYSGLSLFDYGMTFCLKEARSLLDSTDMTVTEITRRLGFSNRTHFYKLFKEKYNMTPKAYRKQRQV